MLDYTDWIHVVAITANDELVLVRQYRHGAGDVFLELPGGTMEAGEDPSLTAIRELEEEAGYRAAETRLVASLFPNPAIQTNRVHTYLATGAEPTGIINLDTGEEGMTVHLMPIQDVIEGLHTGLLPQSLHVASVLLALKASGHLDLRSRLPAR